MTALPGTGERFASALVRTVAANDAPLIDERAATRGPVATEGGDEREVWLGAIRRAPALWRPRPRTVRGAGGTLSRPHPAAFVAATGASRCRRRKSNRRSPPAPKC